MPEPIGWHLLHDAHGAQRKVTVCASAALITYDQRGQTGTQEAGDWVGHVVAMEGGYDGTVTLAGWTFRTVIRWADIRGAWFRDDSPNPCICGNEYPREPRRPIPTEAQIRRSGDA